MKKLDKLILSSFFGPFFLTLAIAEFILLTQYMLKYLDDLVGKDLGFAVIVELLMYFSMNMLPVALPLAVLLSSLMTFGNLGEHMELTAIKTSGISLVRTLLPIFVFTIFISGFAFFFNNNIVPKANLKAYSLLWDIRQKKPSLDLREGSFYNGIPGYSIKVGKKYGDGQTLGDVIIYDHTQGRGNTAVILADSGIMTTKFDDKYLSIELFKGKTFVEEANENLRDDGTPFVRQSFKENRIMFNLSSFNLDRTREELFAENKMMKNIGQLKYVTDSLQRQNVRESKLVSTNITPYYTYFRSTQPVVGDKPLPADAKIEKEIPEVNQAILQTATNKARNLRSFTQSFVERLQNTKRETNNFEIEIYRKYTQSAACLIMFLIGAPLGAIIKKGGLGVPVLISILFFITFYVLSILGEKWGREGLLPVGQGMWMANLILLPIGLFFLYQARNDSALLEVDMYRRIINKLKRNKL
ncbi:LptF/LptG family permease [Adhaeribacter sp. BT258]|uniref:LptF/LptG family permease n=1 Tax=Adhaeribacter terrigena TaxID=2793070 RepID=A0ABS1C113_9BACT|nr:LptF/LptG family permease [Adhaeribacter terrigena]MBK0402862.1 LptF/LptG family permease [Adhaeribacter terrigena]